MATGRLGGLEALEEPYLKIDFLTMIKKRAGWLCALFLSEMLTTSDSGARDKRGASRRKQLVWDTV